MSLVLQSFLLVFIIVAGNEASAKQSRQRSSGGGKIVGGYNATIQQIPYQAYLLLRKGSDYFQCGGSIINARNVLTAAHCLKGIEQAYVRIGSTDSNGGGNFYTTRILISHPRYNSETSDYDVGLVKLSQDMNLDGTSAKAVKLAPANSDVTAGTPLLVSGWGTTSENGQVSTNLMAVEVPSVSRADCNRAYGGSQITARMICAGVPQGGKDSCQGDSGGPALSKTTNQLVGVVSFGYGCARAGFPGVYTNVGAVRSWINRNSII